MSRLIQLSPEAEVAWWILFALGRARQTKIAGGTYGFLTRAEIAEELRRLLPAERRIRFSEDGLLKRTCSVLVGGTLVESRPRKGYRLNVAPSAVSALQVLRLFLPRTEGVGCPCFQIETCSMQTECRLRPLFASLWQAVQRIAEPATLDQFLDGRYEAPTRIDLVEEAPRARTTTRAGRRRRS